MQVDRLDNLDVFLGSVFWGQASITSHKKKNCPLPHSTYFLYIGFIGARPQ